MVLADLSSGRGKVEHDGPVVGQYGEEIVNDNVKRMIAFLKGNELMVMNGRSRRELPQYTRWRAAP